MKSKIYTFSLVLIAVLGLFSLNASGELISNNNPVENSNNELTGFFNAEYDWELSTKDPYSGQTSVKIYEVDNNQVSISFLPYLDEFSSSPMNRPLVGHFNANAGTVTLKVSENQNLGEYNDGKKVSLFLADIVSNPNYDKTNTDSKESLLKGKDEVIGILQQDGSIAFGGENEFFAFKLEDNGYLFAVTNLRFVIPDYFIYTSSDWENIGKAKFEEWVVNPALTTPVSYVLCDVEQNVNNPNEFILKSPYSQDTWSQFNKKSSSSGYLHLTIHDKECVALRPLTNSGMWWGFGTSVEDVKELYPFNLEGFYLFNNEDMTPDKIIEIFKEDELPLSTYDETTQSVMIHNVFFGVTGDPLSEKMLGDSKSRDRWVKITLPENFELGGINDVSGDNQNYFSIYYNLQGVRINTPTPGQIVIRQTGNKTEKIMK